MLTDVKIRKIKILEKKTKYSDEKGMYLEVTPSGGMYWRMKFRFNSKENIFAGIQRLRSFKHGETNK